MTDKTRVVRADRVLLRDLTKSEDYLHEYVMDVSQSGAFVRSNDPLPVGTRVNLRFNVMLEKMEVIDALGEVVRTSGHPVGMGVVFVELSDRSQELLAQVVARSELKAGGAGSA